MTKIDIVSDLHEDIQGGQFVDWSKTKSPDSDLLIIAGDTANDVERAAHSINVASLYYRYVFVTDGNHEHYSSVPVDYNCGKLHAMLNNNVYFLHPNGWQHSIVPEHPNLAIIGCNGWYDFDHPQYSDVECISAWMDRSNDSRRINFGSDIKQLEVKQKAQDASRFIAQRVCRLAKNKDVEHIILVTHTVPGYDLLVHKPDDIEWEKLSGAYSNESMSTIPELDPRIKLWVSGHSHHADDRTIDGIRYLRNPRGYYNGTYDNATPWRGVVQVEFN
jgi:hypothetical protein